MGIKGIKTIHFTLTTDDLNILEEKGLNKLALYKIHEKEGSKYTPKEYNIHRNTKLFESFRYTITYKD